MYIIPQFKGEEKVKYLRKSQADDPLLSVEEILAKHEQMLDEWVERFQPDGGPIPERNTFREVVSGETIAARPAMKELLRLIESPKIKAVLITEPSRLTRGDLEDIGYLVKILRYTNTIVITLNYAFDLNDERDRDQFERELMRGNEYLEYTKKIRLNGRIASVKNGNFIGQTPPYGYRKISYKENKRNIHTLEPDPEQAPVVKRIFELYASGMGCTRICDVLSEEHIPAPKGTTWSPNSLPTILKNVHYLGKVKWNERKTVRTVEEGAVKVSRPNADEFLIFDGKHPAIIEQELWDRVQAIIGTHPRNHKSKNLTNPLAGLLWCECGKAMVGRKYNGPDGQERCAPRFLCGGRRSCGNASAKMDEIINEVISTLQAAVEDFEARLKAGTDDSAEVHRLKLERMEKRLADLRKIEVQQWSEKMKSGMPDHVFKALNEPTVTEIAELEKAIIEVKENEPEPLNLEDKIVTLQATIATLQDPDSPVREQNQLLKKCISRITYSREKYTAVGTPRGMVETPIHLHFELRV